MRVLGQKQDQSRERASSVVTQSKAALPKQVVNQPSRATGNQALGRLLSGTVPSVSRRQSRHREGNAGNGSQAALPKDLKAGIERLSGLAMDDVRVHYNSSRPAGIQALAHTQGTDIYLGPGKEKHLPHEAWHVVQQKQGRVRATEVLAAGASINSDSGLEREADKMGMEALKSGGPSRETPHKLAPLSGSIQPHVVQRKTVPTNFGTFETKNFQNLNDSGVDIVLEFQPDKTKVDAEKIALTQSVRATNEGGDAYAINPTKASRMVPKGKAGAGYTIDVSGETNNPIYFDTQNLATGQDLKDTPESSSASGSPQLGTNTEYILGHCFKKNPSDADKSVQPAALHDQVQGIKKKGAGMMFETTALGIAGVDTGKYYGSVKWGYKIGGTTRAPKITSRNMFDISEASKGNPTSNFTAAAKLWNVGTTRGTLEVNPTSAGNRRSAYARDIASSSDTRLPKGTKLKLINEIKGSTIPMIEAEVLDSSGNGTGKNVQIYVADVKDVGGGQANKPLPLPTP